MLRAVLFVLALVPVMAGCIPLWVGALGVGAVGGYVVSPDTVEGQVMASLEETYDAAKQITTIMGQVIEESPNGSQLVAMISGTRVTVTLIAINVSSTKMSVKARKSFMPKIDVAQDVYTKIINSMER
jgi:hypothetical protein